MAAVQQYQHGAYEGHDHARTILLNEMNSTWGRHKPMSWIVDRVVQELRTCFPNYGKGLVFFGAHALSTAGISTTDVPSDDGTVRELALWSTTAPGGISLHFSIPQTGHVRLSIYDAAGRLVTSICDDELGRGVHTYSWSTASTPSGIYFARLESGATATTQKLLVLL